MSTPPASHLPTAPNTNPASMSKERSRTRSFLSRLSGPLLKSRSARGSPLQTPVQDVAKDSLPVSTPDKVVNGDRTSVALSCTEHVQDGSAHKIPPVDNGPCADKAAIT